MSRRSPKHPEGFKDAEMPYEAKPEKSSYPSVRLVMVGCLILSTIIFIGIFWSRGPEGSKVSPQEHRDRSSTKQQKHIQDDDQDEEYQKIKQEDKKKIVLQKKLSDKKKQEEQKKMEDQKYLEEQKRIEDEEKLEKFFKKENSEIILDEIIDAPPNTTKYYQPYLEWLYENGFKLDTSKVMVKSLGPGYGLGVIAKTKLHKDDPLITVPAHLLLWSQSPNLQHPTKEVVKYVSTLDDVDELILCAYGLAVEMKNPESLWQPYFKVLPFPHCPYFYTDEELEALQNDYVVSLRTHSYQFVSDFYHYALPKLQVNFPEIFGDDLANPIITHYELMVSTSHLYHRAFSSHYSWTLVPFLDLFNNLLLWNKTAKKYTDFNSYYSDKDHNKIFYANFETEPGEQLVDIYQFDFTSVNWLNQYGFCPRDNNLDYIQLSTSIKLDDPIRDKKLKLLEFSKNIGDKVDFYVWSYEPSVDDNFLISVLITQLDSEELLASGIPMGLDDEWRKVAWTWIVDSIKVKFISFPTTIKEDEELLKTTGPSMTPSMYSAVSFRTEMKRVLQKIATVFSDEMKISSSVYEPGRKKRQIADVEVIRSIDVPAHLLVRPPQDSVTR